MMRDALARQRAFNVIHFATSYKFDIFPAGSDPYTKSQFERRQLRQFIVESEEVQFQVASAEDTILSKLLWYKAGAGVSEQQWRDVLSILEMQRERLDREYLREWAERLGVRDLLDRALH
ncbi:MAG TPA: hypothetical protein VJN43_16515 [Bryobacteraceae bacterium]|nr:hypothetical protein [Bryobacteraceae bacterium]